MLFGPNLFLVPVLENSSKEIWLAVSCWVEIVVLESVKFYAFYLAFISNGRPMEVVYYLHFNS